MSSPSGRWTRPSALLFTGAWVAFLCATLAVSLAPRARPTPGLGARDVDLYQGIVGRMRAGEGYYPATGAELRGRGYGVRPVLHWRMPLTAWLLASAPAPRLLLALLAGAAAALTYLAFRRNGGPLRAAVAGAAVLVALPGALVGNGAFFAEVWAAVFLALSIAALQLGAIRSAVVAGSVALLFRELALAYVVACSLLAARAGRRAELRGWLLGLSCFACAYGVHAWLATRQFLGTDALRAPWLDFGGLGFVLSTTRMNAFLLDAPGPALAVYLSLALLGLAGWTTPAGRAAGLSMALYLVTFLCLGRAFNDYWGLLTAPLLSLGIVQVPSTFRQLVIALRGD